MKNLTYLFGLIISLFISCSGGENEEPYIPGNGDITVEIVPSDNTPVRWQQIGFYIKHNANSFKNVTWVFGDGTIGSGIAVNHSYKKDGKYDISVVATTDDGETVKHTVTLNVGGRSFSKSLKFFDNSRVWICAHRCNTGTTSIPENSITALKKCIELGSIDIVEIDPRVTSDGVIVLMHDETVTRTTNGTGEVSEMTYSQIRSLRLKLTDGTVTSDTIPTLRSFLLEAKGKIYIDLDYIGKVPHWELYSLVKDCDMLDQVMFYTSSDSQAINSLLNYTPPAIVFTQTGKESDAVSYSSQGIYVTQISAAKLLDSNLGFVAVQNSLVVFSNTLVQNGITIDNDIKYNNDYSGVDNFLSRGINIIQTDQAPLIDNYLKSKNKR